MKRFFLFFCLFALIISCAPPSYREHKIAPPPPQVTYAPPKETFLYQEGKADFERDNLTEAMEKLTRFIELNPDSDLTDDALLLIGQIFLKRENPYEALRYFERIERDFPGSDTYQEALYGQAFCWYRLKDFARSKEKLEKLLTYSLPDVLAVRALTLKGHLCVMQRLIPCGVEAYLSAREKSVNPTEQSILDAYITRAVLELNDTEFLKGLIQKYVGDVPGQAAQIRLAELLIGEKKFEEAKALLAPSFLETLPKTLRQKAEILLGKLERVFIKKVSIGCLLPLTGKRAPFGLRALKGALLAAKAFQPNPKDIEITLFIKDTKGDPETSEKAARELVETDHVQAIIGPMFLNTTKAAARGIAASPVPLISLSQAAGVPALGPHIFRNCLTPTQQIKALVHFLINGLNVRRAAILYPDIPFGKRYMKLFWESFTESGGEIRGAESYLPTDTDFGVPIKKLVGLYYTKERWERGDTPSEDGKFSPIVDFDVLFIPDTYRRVVLIAPQVAFYDITGVTLAGINTWNAPELIKEGKRFVRGAVFTDGFSPKDDAPYVKAFVDAFKARFGESPEILAAQAYDGVAFLVKLFQEMSISSTDDLEQALKQDTGYHGVSGLRYYDDMGEAIRDVLILTVTRKGILPISSENSPVKTPTSP